MSCEHVYQCALEASFQLKGNHFPACDETFSTCGGGVIETHLYRDEHEIIYGNRTE